MALAVGQDGAVYAGTAKGISSFISGAWRPVFPASGKPDAIGHAMHWGIADLMAAGTIV